MIRIERSSSSPRNGWIPDISQKTIDGSPTGRSGLVKYFCVKFKNWHSSFLKYFPKLELIKIHLKRSGKHKFFTNTWSLLQLLGVDLENETLRDLELEIENSRQAEAPSNRLLEIVTSTIDQGKSYYQECQHIFEILVRNHIVF